MAGAGPRLTLTQQPGVVAGVAARPVPPPWTAAGVVGLPPPHVPRPPAQVLQGRAVLVVVQTQQSAASLLQAAEGLALVPLSLPASLLLLLLVHRQRPCCPLLHSQLTSQPQPARLLLLVSLLLQGPRVLATPQHSRLAVCQPQQEGPQASVLLLLLQRGRRGSAAQQQEKATAQGLAAAQQQEWAPGQGLHLAGLQLPGWRYQLLLPRQLPAAAPRSGRGSR